MCFMNLVLFRALVIKIAQQNNYYDDNMNDKLCRSVESHYY